MGLGSAAEARAFVTGVLDRWQLQELCEDAALVVTELVVNATIHARSATVVTLRRRSSAVQIEVSDRSPTLPRRRDPGLQSLSGRGLHILDALVPGWEAVPVDGGKVVVAVLGSAVLGSDDQRGRDGGLGD